MLFSPGVEHTLAPLLVCEDLKGEAIAGGMIARPRHISPSSPPCNQREDLKGEAIAGGLVEALLAVARYHKAEQTTCGAMRCLEELAADRESWPRIVKAGGGGG